MTSLLAALGSVRLRDARDASVIAEAIAAVQALVAQVEQLEQDKQSLQRICEELQTQVAIERLKGVP